MILAPSVGSKVAGYQIERLLSTTATSATYAARTPGGDHLVALEVISEEAAGGPAGIERLARAGETATGLAHPGVAIVEAMATGDGVLCVATPYREGLDLGTLTQRLGALSRRRAVDIITQLAHALDAAHAAGLVHGSLEPARVLVTREEGGDRVLLSGFGFTAEDRSDIRPDDPALGPLPAAYAAPERIRGEVGAPGDIYALAGVLVQTLWGRPPFPRETDAAMLDAQLSDPPPRLHSLAPEVPLYLDEAIVAGLAKEPGHRPASAGEFARSCLPGQATPAGESPDAQKQRLVSNWERTIAAGTWSPSEPILAPGPAPAEQATGEEAAAVAPDPDTTEGQPEPDAGAAPATSAAAAPRAPNRPARTSSHRRRKTVRAVAGVVALAAAAALVVILATSGGDSDEPAPPAGAADAPRPSTPPGSSDAPGQAPGQPAALAQWPDRSAYTVIVYVSDSARDPAARFRARRAARQGLQAGVLDSSDYPNLEPGLFVAFAGVFLSRREAEAAAARLRDSGVAAAPYVRFVDGG